MKINKYFFTVLGFVTGMVAGISVISLMAFTRAPAASAPAPGIVPISAVQAHTYFTNYLSGAASLNQVVRGFLVEKTQLDAMNSIARENPDLQGFRIYFGKDGNGNKTGIVVGVDINGKDAVKNTIYNADAPKSSPCPPICDSSSPITIN